MTEDQGYNYKGLGYTWFYLYKQFGEDQVCVREITKCVCVT